MMIPVKGYSQLYRDKKTNAIINCNSYDYDEYLRVKNKLLEDQVKINNLENDIQEIKSLLKKFIENK